MVLRLVMSGSNNRQIIEEMCECCGEPLVGEVHISEITHKAFKDERTVKIKDASNADLILKKKDERIEEIKKEDNQGITFLCGRDAESADESGRDRQQFGQRSNHGIQEK